MGSWKNISDLEKINFVAHENRYDNLVVAANYIKNEEILPKIISQELRLAHVDLSILTAEKEELEGLHIIKKVLEISKSAEDIIKNSLERCFTQEDRNKEIKVLKTILRHELENYNHTACTSIYLKNIGYNHENQIENLKIKSQKTIATMFNQLKRLGGDFDIYVED